MQMEQGAEFVSGEAGERRWIKGPVKIEPKRYKRDAYARWRGMTSAASGVTDGAVLRIGVGKFVAVGSPAVFVP